MNAQGTTLSVKETEVLVKAKRRGFTAEFKAKILEEASRCTKRGELGALLRREGLYSSSLTAWRKSLKSRGDSGLEARRRGPKPPDHRDLRISKLERELSSVRSELARSNAIIDIQKKVSELFGFQPLLHNGFS